MLLELPMVSLLPEEVLAELRHRLGTTFGGLSADEVQAVVTAQVEGSVTNLRLQGMLAMHCADITRMLGSLVRRGFLVSDGVGPGTRYFVAREGTPPVSSGTPPVSAEAPLPALELYETARRVRESQRAKPAQMREAIQRICANDFLTAQQIADLLGRSKKRLQDEFPGPMCAKGLLVMRYPETPNHKQQAYRSALMTETNGAAS